MCAGIVGCYEEPTVVPEKRSCCEMNKHTRDSQLSRKVDHTLEHYMIISSKYISQVRNGQQCVK